MFVWKVTQISSSFPPNCSSYFEHNAFNNSGVADKYQKVSAGFTCPNRDGTLSTSGCIFCSERGSGDHIKFCSNSHTIENFISDQVKNYFTTYKAERANKFIAYFQNFTNTYDSISNLKLKYDSALIDNRIVALAVATRPDCINEDICKLLKSYCDK